MVAMLINAAVRVGQRLAAQGRDEASRVMEQVDHHSAELVTRIGYLVLSDAGQHLLERVDRVLRSNELRAFGFPATEIAVLLRSQFRNASPEVRNEYAAAVESGPNREALSTGLRRSYGRDPTQEEIDDRVHHYQRRILTYFRGDIPEELRDLAERLGVLGVIPSRYDQEMAEVGASGAVESGAWLGEKSPISVEELGQSSVGEIVALLVEWSPGEGNRIVVRAAVNSDDVREGEPRDGLDGLEWRAGARRGSEGNRGDRERPWRRGQRWLRTRLGRCAGRRAAHPEPRALA